MAFRVSARKPSLGSNIVTGIRPFLLASGSVVTLLLASPALAEKWDPSLDAIGRAGSDSGGGALDLLVPLYQDDDTLLYGNALGGLDSDSAIGTAVGVGLRLQLDESLIVGGFAYGDWLKSGNDSAFWQVTGGLEVMTEEWEVRAIGYLPVTGEQTVAYQAPVDGVAGTGGIGVGTGVLAVQGNELGIQWQGVAGSLGSDGFRTQEALLRGFEGEVGWKLPLGRALGDNWEVRTYLGGYHFSAEDYDTFAGPRARIELRGYDLAFLGDGARVTLGAEASWDDPRGVTGAGLLRVRIPLGWFTNERKEMSPLDRRMVDPIPRRITPLTDSRTTLLDAEDGSLGTGAFEAVAADQTGNEVSSIYFASGTAGGNGTAADSGQVGDATTLADAAARAGANGLVVLLGGDGDIAGTATLAAGQILLGADTTLAVTGTVSGANRVFNADDFVGAALGTRATVVSTAAVQGNTIEMGAGVDGTYLVGFNIDAGAAAVGQRLGVVMSDSSDHLVRDIDVTGGAIAFLVDDTNAANSGNSSFEDITATDSGVGLYVSTNMGSGLIDGLTVTGATFTRPTTNGVITPRGLQVGNLNFPAVTNMTLTDVSVLDVPGTAATFSNVTNLSITNYTATGSATNLAGSSGLFIQSVTPDFNNNLTLDGIDITNFSIGLRLRETANSSFTNITLTDNRMTGLEVQSGNNNVFDGVIITGTGTVAGTGDTAARFVDSLNVTIANFVIDGETGAGTQVTDRGIGLEIGFPADQVSVVTAASTGTTIANITAKCFVNAPANVTGSFSYDDLDNGVGGIVTCPP